MTDTIAAISADSVPDLIARLVLLVAPYKPENADASASLLGDYGYHSLALAELGFTIEDLFGLEALPLERAMALENVNDIVEMINEELAAGSAVLPEIPHVSGIFARYGEEWPA